LNDTLSMINGMDKYHGDYKNDYRHGQGMFWTPNEYYNLQKLWYRKYCEGVLISNEEIYTGLQRDSETPQLGFGTVIDSMGIRYEGDFVNFKRHGKGCLTLPSGEKFIGEWAEGKRYGTGMRQTPEGKYYYIQWENDEPISETLSDELNWNNFFWYDEGGFASHN